MKVNPAFLVSPTREILEQLQGFTDIFIKGGIARYAVLVTMMRSRGKIIEKQRIQRESEVKDIDLILCHYRRLKESMDYLLNTRDTIKEILKPIIRGTTIELSDWCFEPFRISQVEPKKENTIKNILSTRDLTMNQVILHWEASEGWIAYFTPAAYRDLLYSIGFLTTQGWKTIRKDSLGRLLPSNYGFYRLFKYLAEGKVSRIWLPDWMIREHFKEIERLHQEGKLPEGATLGRYALIIAHKYKNTSWKIKHRWMRILRGFGFTDIPDFDTFAKEQELLFSLNEKFDFESEISLEEIIDKMITERREKQKKQHERKLKREECDHKFETITCKDCVMKCRIKKCKKCGLVLKPQTEDFYCNLIFKTANWKQWPTGLKKIPSSKILVTN